MCGNGPTEFGEQYADGNRQDGDGCSSVCRLEQGIYIYEYTRAGYVNGYAGGHTQHAIGVSIKVRDKVKSGTSSGSRDFIRLAPETSDCYLSG